MSIPLPSIKPSYDEYDEALAKLSPAARYAAKTYGVERRFLRYAEPYYINDPQEYYQLHHYSTLIVAGFYKRITVTYEEQFQNALNLLNNGCLWCEPAGLIVINAPYYLFDGSYAEPDRGPDGFLAHLLCSLAHRALKPKSEAARLCVNFLGTMQLDSHYALQQRHLLIWGPLTEHSSAYEHTKTIQFLYSFRHYTRILLTSSPDLSDLLAKLHINPEAVSYFFNFNTFKDGGIPPIPDTPVVKIKARPGRKKATPILDSTITEEPKKTTKRKKPLNIGV